MIFTSDAGTSEHRLRSERKPYMKTLEPEAGISGKDM